MNKRRKEEAGTQENHGDGFPGVVCQDRGGEASGQAERWRSGNLVHGCASPGDSAVQFNRQHIGPAAGQPSGCSSGLRAAA